MFNKGFLVVVLLIVSFFCFSFFRFEQMGDKLYRCRWTNMIYGFHNGEFSPIWKIFKKDLNKEAPE